MKKYFVNKYTIPMIVAAIMGAISQPLIAYTFISVDSIYSLQNPNIKFSDFYVAIFVVAVAMIFASLSHIIKSYISNIEMNNLRKDMFRAILNKLPNEFHTKDSGEYYNYVLKKVDTWQSGYYDQIWNILQQIIALACIFSFIFYINIMAGLICIVVLIPLALNNIIFPNIIGRSYNKFLDQDGKMVVKLKEFLAGFDIIKFNLAENIYSNKLNKYFDKANKYNQNICILNNVSGSFANICVVISQAGGVGISLVLLLKNVIGIGHFVALVQLLSYANEPVIHLINSLVSFSSIKSINLELKEQLLKNTNNSSANRVKFSRLNELKLVDITYRYPEKQNYVFSDFSQSFKRGNKYLIIGESGSGKSTLIKIIIGLIKDFHGNVFWDNQKIMDEDIYNIVGLVPQDIFIFDDTIRNNIDLLNSHTDDEIENVINKVQLTKFVKSKSEGIYSKINEEVLQISGGERARIGVARAMLEYKPVVIFDEILSSLDKDNSYKIEKMILELDDRMIIHIAHKYSDQLVKNYDQVIDLSKK